MAMYPSEKLKIEMNNVEDMKDVANEFDILHYQEILEKRRAKDNLYQLNQSLITQDLEMLKNEMMDRENLRKLRDILEFIEKNDYNYYFQTETGKKVYKAAVVEIFNNFYDDLRDPNNHLIDYNLVREALKFVTYMEESEAFKEFFEIYNTASRDLKGKLKEHEDVLLGKLNFIVKAKQKKRRQDITKKKKCLHEEIANELNRNNIPKTNNQLENDFYGKKEEDVVKKNNNFDMILNEDNRTNAEKNMVFS